MYYAYQAYNNGVTLYTIGVGSGTDPDILQAMATGSYTADGGVTRTYFNGNGVYYAAETPDQLAAIFEQILDSIVVRIVG